MRTLTRHIAIAFLARAGLAGLVVALAGALAGAVEEANRAGGAAVWRGSLAALARVPETLFFATPAVALAAALWTARDLVPASVAEGLAGAGVRTGTIDRAMRWGAVVVGLAAVVLGGWIAPWAQRAAAPDAGAAWARSGGSPAWAGRSWVWVYRDGVLERVETDGARTGIARSIAVGHPGKPAGGAHGRGVGARSAPAPPPEEIDLLATPPAWLAFPDLLVAGSVRRSLGHLSAPVDAEIAMRAAVVVLLAAWVVAAASLRRMQRPSRRWAFAAALVLSSLLGLQGSAVWAARGELPAAGVVVVPLALAGVVAALARRAARRPRV